MSYLIINLTNYGEGFKVLGTTRSLKRAWEIADELIEATVDDHEECQDGWRVVKIANIDKYTTDGLIKYAKSNLMIKPEDK